MNSNIYKDRYEFEWNHRSHLSSALNIPIAVTTVLGGSFVILIQSFPFAEDWLTYLFVFFLCASIVGLITAIFFLCRAVLGYCYKCIPTPLRLKKYYDELVAWWERHEGTRENASDDLMAHIDECMAKAVEVNATNNLTKSAFIYRSNAALIVTLIFLFASSIPFLIKTKNFESQIIRVEIVEPESKKTEVINMVSKDDQTQEQPAQEEPINDPKPVGPPNVDIREHKLPPEKLPECDE